MTTHAPVLALVASALSLTPGATLHANAQPDAPPFLDQLRVEANELLPHVETDAVREWLHATARLTPITPRSIWFRPEPRAILGPAEYDALPEPDRTGFTPRPITDANYYMTGYGTPLCYARALDLAAQAANAASFKEMHVLDYGYGQIGQLRLLAACGAHVVGVDPSPGLAARYSLPEDQGPYPPTDEPQGSVKVVTGFWPGNADTADAVGSGFDLIIARNVLKHGYVHPVADVPATTQIDLSCPEEEFLKRVHDALNPGGLLLIYNLGGPRLREGVYDASADINCPWTRAALESAGFEVLAFDADDSGPTREQVLVFGWAEAGDPVDSDWFSLYTLVRRPR